MIFMSNIVILPTNRQCVFHYWNDSNSWMVLINLICLLSHLNTLDMARRVYDGCSVLNTLPEHPLALLSWAMLVFFLFCIPVFCDIILVLLMIYPILNAAAQKSVSKLFSINGHIIRNPRVWFHDHFIRIFYTLKSYICANITKDIAKCQPNWNVFIQQNTGYRTELTVHWTRPDMLILNSISVEKERIRTIWQSLSSNAMDKTWQERQNREITNLTQEEKIRRCSGNVIISFPARRDLLNPLYGMFSSNISCVQQCRGTLVVTSVSLYSRPRCNITSNICVLKKYSPSNIHFHIW